MELSHRRVQRDRLLDMLDCHLMPADLIRNHAQEVKRSRMVGLDLQNLPVERLRLRQAAGPVVLEGEIQGFGDCRHRHSRLVDARRFPDPPADTAFFFVRTRDSSNAVKKNCSYSLITA